MKFARKVLPLALALALSVSSYIPYVNDTAQETVFAATTYSPGTYTVTADSLYVRSGPAATYSKLGAVSKGTKWTVTSVSNTKWGKITYNGKTGYISLTYCSLVSSSSSTYKTGTYKVNTDLNVRSGAGTSYGVIGTVETGTSWKVTSVTNGWGKITYNGKTGYIALKYCTYSAETTKSTDESGTSDFNYADEASSVVKTVAATADGHTVYTGKKYQILTALNMRQGAGTSYSVVTTIPAGKTVTVTATKTLSTGTVWGKCTYGSSTGWICLKSSYAKDLNSYVTAVKAHTYTLTSTKSPTCTTAGSKVYTCKYCGYKKTTSIGATGHSWISSVTKEATCTTSGEKTYTCENCSATKTESIPATGHSYNKWTITKKATCTTNGVKTYTCQNCNKQITETIKATGHTWGEGVTVAPTCDAEGYTEYTCTKCGETKQEDIVPATGHSWDKESIVGAVTKDNPCDDYATVTYKCSICGETKTEQISSTPEHSYVETSRIAATCSSEGSITYTCSNCGATKTEVLKADGVSHASLELVNAKEATETEDGYTGDMVCVECGTVVEEGEVIPAGGQVYDEVNHTWDDGTITKQATCTEEGEITYVCTTCGAENKVSIVATGHSYDEGTVTTAATCTKEGIKTYTCTKCGATYTETIEKAEHTWTTSQVWVVDQEAYTETVDKIYCECGASFDNADELDAHQSKYLLAGDFSHGQSWVDEVEVDHPEVGHYETIYRCSVCGATK